MKPNPPYPREGRFLVDWSVDSSLVSSRSHSSISLLSLSMSLQPIMTSFTARHVLMSDAEQELVLKHANECIESECALDEVSELLSVLKGTERELEQRLEKIMNTVSHLQGINAKQQRKTDEVRAFVKDLLRVFAHEVRD